MHEKSFRQYKMKKKNHFEKPLFYFMDSNIIFEEIFDVINSDFIQGGRLDKFLNQLMFVL